MTRRQIWFRESSPAFEDVAAQALISLDVTTGSQSVTDMLPAEASTFDQISRKYLTPSTWWPVPLDMPRKSDAWDGFRDVVAFPAEDSLKNTPVGCAISEEALVNHFGGLSGNIASLLGAFRRYRAVIERAASDRYDGQGKPSFIVLSSDDFAIRDASESTKSPGESPSSKSLLEG